MLEADVVITMLADDAAVRAVWLDSGLAARLPKGAVHLNMATVSMGIARELAAIQKDAYVSAPVFGRPPVAAQGQLDIIAAGPKAALREMRAAVSGAGEADLHRRRGAGESQCGEDRAQFPARHGDREPRRGLSRWCASAASSRQISWEILGNTSLGSPAYKNYGKMIVDQAWTPAQFAMPLGREGCRARAGHRARGRHGSAFQGELIRKHLLEAIAEGRAEQDWAALAGKLAADAGL